MGSWSLLLFPSHILLFNDAFCGWYLCRHCCVNCTAFCCILMSIIIWSVVDTFRNAWPLKPAGWISDQGGRGSRVHNRLAVVIGAGLLVVEVATALAGQWVSEWVSECPYICEAMFGQTAQTFLNLALNLNVVYQNFTLYLNFCFQWIIMLRSMQWSQMLIVAIDDDQKETATLYNTVSVWSSCSRPSSSLW